MIRKRVCSNREPLWYHYVLSGNVEISYYNTCTEILPMTPNSDIHTACLPAFYNRSSANQCRTLHWSINVPWIFAKKNKVKKGINYLKTHLYFFFLEQTNLQIIYYGVNNLLFFLLFIAQLQGYGQYGQQWTKYKWEPIFLYLWRTTTFGSKIYIIWKVIKSAS